MEIGLGVGNSPESGGVVMEFSIFDGADLSSPPTVPDRLRRRLTESKVSTSSIEEIEAKLHNADLRRQKFYENLSSKARSKHKSPQAADEHNLAQRLEAKLQAAEQKRMQILKAQSQRRATLNEKTSQSLKRMIALQNQKHSVADKNSSKVPETKKKAQNSVSQQQEIERSKSLEDRLQKAKRQKADYLVQNNIVGVNWNNKTQKQADHLSRNLKRCWRKFLEKRTTLNLTKSYHILNINSSQIKSMPFEHFAFLIESYSTLQTTKALLDRIETRYRVLLNVTSQTNLTDINHLLTRVVSPNNKYTKTVITLSRYQPRVVLSGYMILAHPDAVFSGQGVRETALTNSAKKFIQEFELLIDIILNGPKNRAGEESDHERASFCTFRSQVAAFDESWCSFLNSFVVWKVKDVESLEEDLIRAACQMEISMMKKYKRAPEVDDSELTDDVKFFQKQMQVTEHQKLLMEKIMHLSGEAGIARLQKALSDTRKSKDKSTPADSALTVSSNEKNNNSSSVASTSDSVMENVLIVNEFLHGQSSSVTDRLRTTDEKKKVGEIMEKAFWDGITESIKEEKYDHVVVLMKEVRDELSEMSPKIMKQEIFEIIDLDILSQLLTSGRLDMEYLGKIMEFALISLQKLSAVAHENQLKESHQKFISEIAQLCQAGDGSTRSHAIALIKGLRFVLEQIQALKQEISKARIKIMESLVKGPSGLEYLEKAFRKQYGPPSDALIRLPRTLEWLSAVVPIKDESWDEHKMALLQLQQASGSSSLFLPSTALRTGGSFSTKLQTSTATSFTDNGFTDCKGEKGHLLVRLGLLNLVNTVNGVTLEELPETLKLNYLRLRSVQNQLQKITVIATSILVLRQTLIMEKIISNPEEIESTILTCSAHLSNVLDTVTDAGLEELVEILGKTIERFDTSNNLTKSQSTRLVIARMLTKSLQAGDPVFVRVSRAVYLATRGVVLGGCGGGGGRELAVVALRRVSAAVLTDKVVEAAVVLGVMARVSENVHGLWYAQLIENM